MKTLKKDGVNEKLLIDTLAYISSHEATWKQAHWRGVEINGRCKTSMCFAGHAAITLGDGEDLVKLPSVGDFRAVYSGKPTEAQEKRVLDWQYSEDYLKPKPSEIKNRDFTDVELADGSATRGVGIQSRAMSLLGRTAVVGRSGRRNLFAGEMTLPRIYTHVSVVLDCDMDTVIAKVKKSASANNWRIPASVINSVKN